MKLKRVLLLLGASFPLLNCCLSANASKRAPNLFLVPNGYVGWLEVHYGVEDAPALSIEGGYRIYDFPSTGRIKTSSAQLYGLAKDKVCYLTPQGQKELFGGSKQTGAMLWGDRYVGGEGDSSAQYVFVGTWKQFEKVEKNPPWLHK